MIVCAGLLWTCFLTPMQDSERYIFKNVSATYIIARINGFERSPGSAQGLIPDSLKVTVDAATNSVTLKGTAEEIQSVKRIFEIFDVRAVRVEMEVEGYLPLLDYRFKNTVTVANNCRWELHEPTWTSIWWSLQG